MARTVTTLTVSLALGLTLALPIYPEGMEPVIAVFLGLCATAGVFGLADRKARYELAIMAPWAVAVLLATLVGSIHHGESRQALEDALPYGLFVLGLVAGRSVVQPRRVLQIGLWACVADTLVSLWLMDEFSAGMRSSYNYYKITAGLPLVGLYLAGVLRVTPRTRPNAFHRGWHFAAVALFVIGVVLSVTRGMMLGALLMFAVSAYVRRPSQFLLLSTLVLVGLVAWSSTVAEFGAEYLRLRQGATIEGRFREVAVAWEGFTSRPLLGQGLGSLLAPDGFKKAFVHNVVAYHLWKFGLVGSALLALPLIAIARELRHTTVPLRALAMGGAAGCFAYLVSCAAYKTYYLVWFYGVVVGVSLTYFESLRAGARAREARRPQPRLRPVPAAATSVSTKAAPVA